MNNSYWPFSSKGYYASKGVKEGFQLFVINSTNKHKRLHYQAEQFSIFRIVFFQGKWRNVISHSSQRGEAIGCGNHYFSRYYKMQKGTYLSFLTPCIDGNAFLKTRFVMLIEADDSNGNLIPIFSNEFEASIDTSLIEKSKGFQIMDASFTELSPQ
ncbi:hypothetical protein [Spongiimicrobium salis]|uniref:hypothetical protein n=1 Tax=Spongiimicrobium salis TaxID=1667022 RepID=UPI00374D78EC